jgi:Fic family protein
MNDYTLTPALLANIGVVERLYGQLETLHLPKKLQLNLERDNLVESSYISNSIEGNPLSFPEVSNLLLGDRVPANRSEKEVRNYFDILKSLQTRAKEPFTLQAILDTHRDLMQGLDEDIAGIIRDKRVVVGHHALVNDKVELQVKHEPPFHDREHITQALQELVDWYNAPNDILPLVKIGMFHHHYVHIHPFVDGNGRTVRLLTALLFIRNGYAINKYFVLDDYYDLDRKGYSDALHTADDGDSTKWLEYFALGTKYSLQSALSKSRNALLTLNVSERPSQREQDALKLFATGMDVTSADVAKALGVSRQQAQNLLSGLVGKGLIEKFGSTKSSYYRVV